MSESCATCRFGVSVENPKVPALKLECRRRPPEQGQRPAAEWPKVAEDGWCGEYDGGASKPAPAKAVAAKKAAQAGEVETRSEQG